MDENLIEISTEVMQVITAEQAWRYSIIPLTKSDSEIEFYHSNNNNSTTTKEELEILFGKKVILHEMPEDTLKKSLSKYYLKRKISTNDSHDKVGSDNKNISKSTDFLSSMVNEASSLNSSDIHIEAYEGGSRIRFRIDGKLFERYIIKKEEYPAIINQIKILSGLDIAEKRLPQDGRILFKTTGMNYDIRVSVIPSIYGEKAVLRLLRKSASDIVISDLGFSKGQLDDYLAGIRKPNGILLISGPTGSGKTTTLYATLNILNKKDINILSIEDPVEYTIEGINQVQLREDIGLTFAKALKTFLRQDPDIIMLGEVRDAETAQMAIRAALTGHLVLSTIHTNSAWGIITRLIDMGIPPFLLSSTINTVVAQRLVRKLCPNCKKEISLDVLRIPASIRKYINQEKHFISEGCENCFNSGYHGRVAIYEVINIDNELRELMCQSVFDIKQFIIKRGIQSLTTSALELFKNGITSFEEIAPILSDDY
jgi:type IV pilus assembly protein PilB